jgi:serine/threonine-protein kinase
MDLSGKIGKYTIIKKLGSGGFGTVYLAEDTILKTFRALKIPHKFNSQAENLYEESIVQTKLLDHPNIVKLLTVDIIDRHIIMVQEYVEGTDLEKILDEKCKVELPIALRYFKQILSALDFAHQHKVIHRDIRPSNLMIDKNNNIKITDFGTSTFLNEKQFATTKIGSPPYMAPEHFEGRAVLASDIYSAGCLFYEMITGFPPVVMANPMEIYKKAKAGDFPSLIKKCPEITQEINTIIMKTLAASLADRYRTAGQVLHDLENLDHKKPSSGNLEIDDIKNRINARKERVDYVCWKCRKTMPRKMSVCLYCGADQNS